LHDHELSSLEEHGHAAARGHATQQVVAAQSKIKNLKSKMDA
jgi:hypothetical protein